MHSSLLPHSDRTICETDLCVIGGSCTGVFAAVRAARLGLRVAIVEKQNRFGGTAVCGLVSTWHNLFDFHQKQRIIGGLTVEVLDRLAKKNAVTPGYREANGPYGVKFNSEELCLELDKLILEHKVEPYLDTLFTRPVMRDDTHVNAVLLENRSGTTELRAKFFIDASGDGFLCQRAGFPVWTPAHPQPPTACARILNWDKLPDFDLSALIEANRAEFPDLPCGYHWGMYIPGGNMFMLAGTRVLNCDLSNGLSYAEAEITARRQIDSILCLLRARYPEANLSLQALPSALGIRETVHIHSEGRVKGLEMITGKRYEDAIANGTYLIDIHDDSSGTISFRSLDGLQRTYRNSTLIREEHLLPPGAPVPGFYQIPFSSLVPQHADNVLAAGRMLDADREAFGAVRVMVNLNQCGEAAGCAAALCVQTGVGVRDIDILKLRETLRSGGSILP